MSVIPNNTCMFLETNIITYRIDLMRRPHWEGIAKDWKVHPNEMHFIVTAYELTSLCVIWVMMSSVYYVYKCLHNLI